MDDDIESVFSAETAAPEAAPPRPHRRPPHRPRQTLPITIVDGDLCDRIIAAQQRVNLLEQQAAPAEEIESARHTVQELCELDERNSRQIGCVPLDGGPDAIYRACRDAGVSDEQFWINAYVYELEQASLAHFNALDRDARLDGEAREKFPATLTLLELAEGVLKRTRARLAKHEPLSTLPAWISDCLTAIYIGRYGFATGGGPTRRLSRATIVRLLLDPSAACADLRRSGSSSGARLARDIQRAAAETFASREIVASQLSWRRWEAAAKRLGLPMNEWVERTLNRYARRSK